MGDDINLATYYRYGAVFAASRFRGLLTGSGRAKMVRKLSATSDLVEAEKEAPIKFSRIECSERAVPEA